MGDYLPAQQLCTRQSQKASLCRLGQGCFKYAPRDLNCQKQSHLPNMRYCPWVWAIGWGQKGFLAPLIPDVPAYAQQQLRTTDLHPSALASGPTEQVSAGSGSAGGRKETCQSLSPGEESYLGGKVTACCGLGHGRPPCAIIISPQS